MDVSVIKTKEEKLKTLMLLDGHSGRDTGRMLVESLRYTDINYRQMEFPKPPDTWFVDAFFI